MPDVRRSRNWYGQPANGSARQSRLAQNRPKDACAGQNRSGNLPHRFRHALCPLQPRRDAFHVFGIKLRTDGFKGHYITRTANHSTTNVFERFAKT
jgi:hypothetical protein